MGAAWLVSGELSRSIIHNLTAYGKMFSVTDLLNSDIRVWV
jgi:hypothetical protein